LDLRIIEPYFDGNIEDKTYSKYITIEKLELKVTGFEDVLGFTNVLNEDFTINKESELTYADDASGFSKAFRLAKLEERGTDFNTLNVPVLYGRTFQNRNYSVVSLRGANLIADNPDTVRYNSNPIVILNVFYNWRNGEEMVVETENAITTGSFEVLEYNIKDVTGDRSHWEQWTDVVYPIERDRYNESVSKVFRRLFINAHERVEYLAEGALKFNDLVLFNYMLPANYFITDLTWDMDQGKTQIAMIKCIYQNDIVDVGTENIPPICNAGADVVLPAFFPTLPYTHLTGTAFDPDGFIARWFWEIIEGDDSEGVLLFNTVQFPIIRNFSGNEITLRLTVKDNDGATATDTVKLTKRSNRSFSLVEDLYFNEDGSESGGVAFMRDSILFNPQLADNEIITVKGGFSLRHIDPKRYDNVTRRGITTFQVIKNGVQIINNVLEGNVVERLGDFEFNYVNGDEIKITVQCFASFVALSSSNYIDLRAGYEINSMVFQQGSGEVTGYPVSREVRYIGEQ